MENCAGETGIVIYQASELYPGPGTTLISAGHEVQKYLLLAMQLASWLFVL